MTRGALRAPTPHVTTGVREDGTRWVRSFKIVHPLRQQRVYIMPVPRFATKAFYNDWVYQPYIKDNSLAISTDIESPPFYQNAAWRLYFKPRRETDYKDYDLFYSPNLPDSVDANITRHEMYYKEFAIRTPFFRMMLTTTPFRDRAFHYSYVVRGLHKILGGKNQYHPGVESAQSFVIFMPVMQVNTAINALEDLGFAVSEAIEHDIGEDAKLAKLHTVGSWANFLLIVYTWTTLWLVINAYVKYIMDKAEEHKAEFLELKLKAHGKEF